MLLVTRRLLQALLLLNVLVGIPLLMLLAWSFVDAQSFLAAAMQTAVVRDEHAFLAGVRLALATVAPVMIAAHVLLGRLLGVLRSVEAGEPFAAANAARLRTAAWALLAIQLCDLLFGYGAVTADLAAGERVSGWSPGLTGWIAVLLVFVLAEVFREGARLRDEAELTI